MELRRLREEYRGVLRVPLGISLWHEPRRAALLLVEIAEIVQPPLTVAVGDFVARNLIQAGLEPSVAIVDFRTMRADFGWELPEVLKRGYERVECRNPPGTLSEEAVRAVKGALKKAERGARVLVVVDGEEDLLALPAIEGAPPRSLVVYGLWLGAAVAVICHPLISRCVAQFMERAFEPSVRRWGGAGGV